MPRHGFTSMDTLPITDREMILKIKTFCSFYFVIVSITSTYVCTGKLLQTQNTERRNGRNSTFTRLKNISMQLIETTLSTTWTQQCQGSRIFVLRVVTLDWRSKSDIGFSSSKKMPVCDKDRHTICLNWNQCEINSSFMRINLLTLHKLILVHRIILSTLMDHLVEVPTHDRILLFQKYLHIKQTDENHLCRYFFVLKPLLAWLESKCISI
jgi:hypothetical protein